MSPITETLDPWEYKHCCDVAAVRMATSNGAGWNHASTYQRTYLKRSEEEIVGACGEMVVAKALDCYWSPSVNTFHRQSDLTRDLEVRATVAANNRLIVRDNDADDRIYVLVVGEPPTMTVVGWIYGHEAKRDEWRKNPHDHRPAWFVPQSALRPMPPKPSAHPLAERIPLS